MFTFNYENVLGHIVEVKVAAKGFWTGGERRGRRRARDRSVAAKILSA